MSTGPRSVMLIDDNPADNFYNKRLLKAYPQVEKVVEFELAQEALDALKNGVAPDLILLDINMPAMNGWEFLEAFTALPESQRGAVIVIMLTTSLNPEDRAKADQWEALSEFFHKPLEKDALNQFFEQYFA